MGWQKVALNLAFRRQVPGLCSLDKSQHEIEILSDQPYCRASIHASSDRAASGHVLTQEHHAGGLHAQVVDVPAS